MIGTSHLWHNDRYLTTQLSIFIQKTPHKTYFMLQKLKKKNISKKLNLRLRNTIIDKTLTYASETGTLTERERKQLNIF